MVNYKKIGIGVAAVGLVVANVFGGIALNNNINDNTETLKVISEQTKEDETVVTPIVELTQLDSVQAQVDLIKLKMFEEDAFEAESEVLALEEIEDDDYEALFDFMTNADEMNLSIKDARDIDEVVIEDVKVSNVDVDDEDAVVEYELKVYYENSDGDDKKAYLKVTAEIRDGDVDIVKIEEN